MSLQTQLAQTIRTIPDFPVLGIQFKDITPVLQDIQLFNAVIDALAAYLQPLQIDKIVAIESRGFLFGMPLAVKMGLPLALIRKKGKLPAKKVEASYQLEYGEAVIEIHTDAITADEKVVIIDDLLATGGTTNASIALVEKLKGKVVATAFVIELEELGGREKIKEGIAVYTLING